MHKILHVLAEILPTLSGRIFAELFITPMNQPKVTRGQAMLDQAKILDIAYQRRVLRAFLWGTGEQTVVLCHGWRASAGSMSAFVEPLIAQGFRVLAFDAPAHRDSSGRQVTLDSYSEAIQHAITQYSPVHAVIAHSFGALSLSLLMNQEPILPINYAVLIACPRDFASVAVRFTRSMQLSDRVVKQFHMAMERKLKRKPSYYSAERALSATSFTGLLVHDRTDRIVPFQDSELLANHWKGASRLIVDGLGHNDILRDSETIAQIVVNVAKSL